MSKQQIFRQLDQHWNDNHDDDGNHSSSSIINKSSGITSSNSSVNIVMTTIFVNSGDDDELLIGTLKQIQQVDIQCKLKQIQNHLGFPTSASSELTTVVYKPVICIKNMNKLGHLSEQFKHNTIELLKKTCGLDPNCIIFIDDANGQYLKSLTHYTFSEMIKKKLIQNIPTIDLKVGKSLHVLKKLLFKFYLKKPYNCASLSQYENDTRPLYLFAQYDHIDEIQNQSEQQQQQKNYSQHHEMIFSCRRIEVGNYLTKYHIYETKTTETAAAADSTCSELLICVSNVIKNLCQQRVITLIDSQSTSLTASDLNGMKVSCSIIPHELSLCEGYLDQHWWHIPFRCIATDHYHHQNDDSHLYSMINSELIENHHDSCHDTASDELLVSILLDQNASSGLLQSKFREKVMKYENISKCVESLFIRRGLGFYFFYKPGHDDVIPIENRWCLVTNKKWTNQLLERIRNPEIQKRLSDLRNVIISTSEEFEPDEHSYNYILTSTFIICLQYFKEFNISIDQINSKVWSYLLNHSDHSDDHSLLANTFQNLKTQIQNQNVISIVNESIYGVRCAFFSSFLKKIPDEYIVSDDFIYNGFRSRQNHTLTSKFGTQQTDSLFSDSLRMSIQVANLDNLSDRNLICEAIIVSIVKQCKNLSSYSPIVDINDNNLAAQQTDPGQGESNIMDEYLEMLALKLLINSKQNYSIRNYYDIIIACKNIQDVQIVKMKKSMNQDGINLQQLLRKVFEIISIVLYPLAPKLCSYLWKEVFHYQPHMVEFRYPSNIGIVNDQYCKLVSNKFLYLTKLFRNIEKVLKNNGKTDKQQQSITLSIVVSECNCVSDFDEAEFIMENKKIILQMFRNISDIQIETTKIPGSTVITIFDN